MATQTSSSSLRKNRAWLVLPTALLIGLVLALLDSQPAWLGGWLAYGFMSLAGLGAILGFAWLLHQDRRALGPAFTAFAVRVAAGVILTLLLPTAGYADNKAMQAGYMFKDAHYRDGQAWKLAASDQPLLAAFSGEYNSDQYGGMLWVSAAAYRLLSPQAHRQMLVILLAASIAAIGVLFLHKAAARWFGAGVGLLAGWIMALYPEAVLLGSSQMREPFVIAGIAIALYGLAEMGQRTPTGKERWDWLAWFALGAALLFLFQPPAALAAFAVIFIAWLLDPQRRAGWRRAAVFTGILALAALAVFTVWANLPSLQGASPDNLFFAWLQKNFAFQSYLSYRGSGFVQKLFRTLGEGWQLPIVLAYGSARPVLPAALTDITGALVIRVINLLRALGWYALAPLLVYGLFSALRVPFKERGGQILWLSLAGLGWILIAAANAGADEWDNPRYRTIFLAFQAVLAAWAWQRARVRRDPWLGRWLLVEGGLVLLWSEWYFSRYALWAPHLDIWIMIPLSLVLSAAILGYGLWRDQRRRRLDPKAAEPDL